MRRDALNIAVYLTASEPNIIFFQVPDTATPP